MSASRFSLVLLVLLLLASSSFAQTEILVGDTVTGEASPEAVEYALFLEEGQTVGINLSSEDFDTYLKIFGEDGGLIAENDDRSDAENPNTTDSYLIYSAEESGTIVINVSKFSENGPTGVYSLTIEELQLQDTLELGLLAYGTSEIVESAGASEVSFTFEGTAGDAVSIFAISAGGDDTVMRLEDANANVLASDDDDGFSTNSAIRRFPIPATGSYRVVVTAFGGARLFSNLELRIEESAVLSLNSGAQTISLSPSSTTDVVVLDVDAGTSYIITVNLSEVVDNTLWINTNEGAAGFAGTQMRISGTNFISFAFTPQSSGRASIEVELASFDESIEVTIAAQAR